MDFYQIRTTQMKSNNRSADFSVAPEFIHGYIKDLVCKGGSMYAFWNGTYWDMDRDEERELSKVLEDHFACEPWCFLETEPSPQYKFLVKLHKELIKNYGRNITF